MKKKIISLANRLGYYFHSSWYFINSDCICTTGNVLKLNDLLTYQESGFVDIVRVTNAHIERGYLYGSLFFTSKDEIITIRHALHKGTYVILMLMDKEEYDELISGKI